MSNIIPLNIASLGDEVIIKKGSSGGGGESASTIEYLDLREVDASMASALFGFAILVKENGIILPAYTFAQVTITNIASEIAIDFALEVKAPSYGIVGRIGDIFTSQGIDIDSIPRITKEQFYTLE